MTLTNVEEFHDVATRKLSVYRNQIQSKTCISRLSQFKFVIRGVRTSYYVIDTECYNIFRMNAFIFGANTTLRTLYISICHVVHISGIFGRVVEDLPHVGRNM